MTAQMFTVDESELDPTDEWRYTGVYCRAPVRAFNDRRLCFPRNPEMKFPEMKFPI